MIPQLVTISHWKVLTLLKNVSVWVGPLVTGLICCEDEYAVLWYDHEEVVMHICVVMWKVFLFWFVLQLNMDIQQYFINFVAVASHPICPPLNRKTSNPGSVSHFLWPARGKVMVWVWGGNKIQSRITCTLSIHVLPLPSLPFVPFLSPLLQHRLCLPCHFAYGLSFISHTCQNPHTHIPSVIFHASSVPLPVILTHPMPAVFVLFSAQNTSHTS